MIITIDGPIATGKSTLAKHLAKEIGYIYFDTGAMYRCLTFAILKHDVNLDDTQALKEFLLNFNFDIRIKRGDRYYFYEDEDISLKIRGPEVTFLVSKVSAIPLFREKLVAIQRDWALGVNAVFEGRDMGSVVFPHAQLKIFLTGKDEIRAARRFAELKAKFPEDSKNLTLKEVLDQLKMRDDLDTKREASPLKQAEDAFVIDTSDLSIDEIVLKILEYKDSIRSQLKKTTDS